MFRVEDINGEAIVVDGGWVEKFRGPTSRGRVLAADYKDMTVKPTSRRKRVLFGEKEDLLHVIVDCGTWLSLMVRAEQQLEVDELRRRLEEARGASS